MSKKLFFIVAPVLLLALGLFGCVRSHNTVGPVTPRAGGPGADPFSAANLFYALGYSDVYFTDYGVCYRGGDCVPWSDVRVGSASPYAGQPAVADGRAGVDAATAGPTKDHPWGGDQAATIISERQTLYCCDAGKFVVLATAVGPDSKYWYVLFVDTGLYALLDPVVAQGISACGFYDPFAMVRICKGGTL